MSDSCFTNSTRSSAIASCSRLASLHIRIRP
jgi:hypothetical protein